MIQKTTEAVTISELARRAGVGVETVRFYQRRGLLPLPARTGGPRVYDDGDLRRLRFIRSAQRAGFTLAEVEQLIDLDHTGDRAKARMLAANRVAALDERIASLEASRDALRALITHCALDGGEACPILDAFETGLV